MEQLKQGGKIIVYFFSALIVFLLITDFQNIDLENYRLLLIFNTAFTGLIPIFVAFIAIRTYLNNNLFNALIFGCGMLVFGFGSISTGIWGVLHQSDNVPVTVYNISAFLSSLCLLFSAMQDERTDQRLETKKGTLLKMSVSLGAVGLFVLAINYVSVVGLIPLFMDFNGFTSLRYVVLSMAIAFYFVSALLFLKQYRKRKHNEHFWYALALLMLSLGLVGVCVASDMGNLLGWVGRLAQYIGSGFALISVIWMLKKGKNSKITASDLMIDFFYDGEASYLNLIEVSHDSVISIDEDNTIFIANKSANNIFGMETNSIIHTSFLDFLEQPYKDVVRSELDVYRRTGKGTLIGQTEEMVAIDRAGRVFPVEISFTGRRIQSHYAVSMIIRDITERKQLEINLQNKSKLLQATLVSVGEGVISCDEHGNVLLLNPAAEHLTGWMEEEAKGKPLEEVFNIINENNENKSQNITKNVIGSGKTDELEGHTILISKEGIRRVIQDNAAPIILENGVNVGVVIVFKDYSDRLEKIKRIKHVSYHDHLTGLYNRRFFEEELSRYDTPRNLPITIVMADVNGLKLVNDSFGHESGDELLKYAAKALTDGCRADDIVARHGGDEFIIILPKTDSVEAENLINRIQGSLRAYEVCNIELSISFGHETKMNASQDILELLKKAEDHMYKHKLNESLNMRSQTIKLIMKTLYERNKREMNHSKRVGDLCESLAKHLGYNRDDVNKIRTAGLMHDIGKIGISDDILNKTTTLDEHEGAGIRKHSEIGYRILSSVSEFSEVASFVLQHQERWDGTGYPKGLKEEEIIRQARIIAIAEAFDAMTGVRTYGRTLSETQAAAEIKKCAGTHFDPEIAKVFVEKVLGKSW